MKRGIALLALAAMLVAGCRSSEDTQWTPAGDNIRTKWAEEVSPENARPEYPRPRLIREQWQSLNGLWDYAITACDAEQPAEMDGQILVPFCVESSLSGVGRRLTAADALWYRTSFKVPSSWKKKHTMLNFDAVDFQAEVWVNGSKVGSHTGGYTAFSFDITPYLKPGTQELVVKVLDATNNDFQPRGKQTLKPSGIWYTAVSGIWQTVWLEPVADAHITDYDVVADVQAGKFVIDVNVTGGDAVTLCGVEAPVRDGVAHIEYAPADVRLWTPDTPELYDFDIKLSANGKCADKAKGYGALREISVVTDAAGHKRMALNGEPLFHYGPLDQGWWPDGLYTAPTLEAMVSDIVRTKDYGFNMIRKHIKVEPATWYRACDELGVLVWQDMPSFAANAKNYWAQDSNTIGEGTDWPVDDALRANYLSEWGDIIAQHKGYPCIVVWVPFNEAWGQFDTEDVVAFTRAQDPTRLINHASGGNWIAGCGDIMDSHHYPTPYMRVWDRSMVNVLGEYGGIGLPLEGHLWQKDRNWGYVQYADSEAVTEEYERFSDMLAPLVEDGCSAAVYTQTTDVEGEVNGLMTYDREVLKLDPARVAAANNRIISLVK